ncbi:UNVERIFIED_ORG: methionyl-tRNA formyltransferase [Idiomarina abyssalis]|uniref:formyltransferase family protein n=1 Tax=Idiomarina sp. 017G TaxID=2183988 RepID=UPI000E0FC386|nr:formyltransferase family protein [Idiomarina sp. 017G]TDO50238.1 methionyl-tRNA formyltransferase [Idiomarina sp. 017G]
MTSFEFYLLGYKGFKCLEAFLDAFGSSSIKFVCAEHDKNIDNDFFDEIKSLCEKRSLTLINRYEASQATCSESHTIKFSIGWRWLIKDSKNLIVFHDSLLPRYRGFAPVVNALINGDNTIGATAIWASDDYDMGNIIEQRSLKIKYPIKIADAIKFLTPLYIEMLISISEKARENKEIPSHAQNEAEASYSPWRDEKDYTINWSKDAAYIKRLVDAVGKPYSGARTTVDGCEIVLEEVEVLNDINVVDREQHIGKVIFMQGSDPVVICGQGLLKIVLFYEFTSGMRPTLKFRTRFGYSKL